MAFHYLTMAFALIAMLPALERAIPRRGLAIMLAAVVVFDTSSSTA